MSKPASDPTLIRPAASVVVLRDGADGIETFMLERHVGSEVTFSGALVFPGGKVDAEDAAPAWGELAAATPAAVPDRAFWIAAVRETFEEAGLLLARQPGTAGLIGPAQAQRIVETARAGSKDAGRHLDGHAFAQLIGRERLQLAVDLMLHFGHWITPIGPPRRFDTHFFLAAAPVEQLALLDEAESREGLWIRPATALAEADAGKRTLVPVTRFTLSLLATWPTVGAAVAAARARPVVTVLPRIERSATGRWLHIPPEAGYLTSELFIPAPE